MTVETVQRRRVAIVDGARRVDLVVPAHLSVAAAFHAAGMQPQTGREVVMETAGREIAPDSFVGDLRDGAILVLVDLSLASRASSRGAARSGSDDRPPAAWWLLGAAGAILGALALGIPVVVDPALRLVVGAAAALAAALVAIAVAARAPGRRSSHVAAVLGILLLAFGAGAALVPAVPAATGELGVFVGMLLAAVVAGVMGIVSRSGTLRAETRTAMVVLLVLSGVWGLALLLHAGVVAAGAVTLGLVPVAQRVLLASAVDVPPGTFIDYERFQTTRWTVRQQLPPEVQAIDAADAGALVARSTARLTTGTILFVVAGVLCSPIALGSLDPSKPLVFAGRIALAATVVVALLLSARKSTVPALRWVSRLGAAGVLLAVLLAVIPSVGASTLALVAGICLAVGAASALLVVPAGRGVRSLAWSRAADVFEWIAVALSLPAALLTAWAVELVRGMMAA